jgi:type II secretory pathway pseudopilin PulG
MSPSWFVCFFPNRDFRSIKNYKFQVSGLPGKNPGYTLILLMIIIFIMTLSLTVAVPVLETEVRREKEEELIFRGKQYVEAIRLYQQKKPGAYPSSLEELLKEKCLRKLYPDPMNPSGHWNLLILPPPSSAQTRVQGSGGFDNLLVVTTEGLKKIRNPQIVGVVSSSRKKSLRIYQEEEHYHHWLFYYGQTSGKKPRLIYQTEE